MTDVKLILSSFSIGELAGMYEHGRMTAGISNGELIFIDSDAMTEDRWERIQKEKEAADAGTSYGTCVTDNSDIIARFAM